MKLNFELSGRPKIVKDFLQEVVGAWGETRGSRMSAALAYYAMFAIAPMIFVAFTVASVFVDELAAANEFFSQLETTVGPETAQFLQDVVVNVSQRTTTGSVVTSLIGFVALFYAASGLFTGLRDMLCIDFVVWLRHMDRAIGQVDHSEQLGATSRVVGRIPVLLLVQSYQVQPNRE